MIRVTIERVQYYEPPGEGLIPLLLDSKPTREHHTLTRTLLTQEADDHTFDLEAVICILNNLEPTPPCKCGHPEEMHPGGTRCQHHAGSHMMGERQCDCLSYRSLAQENLRDAERQLMEMRTERDRSLEKAFQLEQTLEAEKTAIAFTRADLGRARATVARLREKNRR